MRIILKPKKIKNKPPYSKERISIQFKAWDKNGELLNPDMTIKIKIKKIELSDLIYIIKSALINNNLIDENIEII